MDLSPFFLVPGSFLRSQKWSTEVGWGRKRESIESSTAEYSISILCRPRISDETKQGETEAQNPFYERAGLPVSVIFALLF